MALWQKISEELTTWVDALVRSLPGRIGRLARRMWLKMTLSSLGRNACFDEQILVVEGKNVSIGDNFGMLRNGSIYANANGLIQIGNSVSLNFNVSLSAADGGRILIGNDVLIGPNTILRTSNHRFSSRDLPINRQGHESGTIKIEDDVWIGAHVVVLPNVTIGAHAIVGAGAVVTRSIAPWTIVAGIPAKEIAKRP